VDSIKQSGKPETFDLSQGMYHCASCVPEVKVKADGSDQSVTGHDYFDSVAVRVVSPTSFEMTNKRAGKTVVTVSYAVSDGGALLNGKFTDYTGAQPVSGNFSEKRVGPAPAGAHAASGSWQTEKLTELSDVGRAVTYAMTADALKMTYNGQSYEAKFDGNDYPIAGDPGKTVVSVKRLGADTIEETDKRDGKVTDIIRTTVSGDGKTLHVVDNDPIHETRMEYIADKQP
jgi:butyrate kinase